MHEEAALGASFPVVVDLLGVAVAAGCTPYPRGRRRGALGPAALRRPHCPQCSGRAHSAPGSRRRSTLPPPDSPALRGLVDALLASDRLGAPVGPQLARLADEERAALRRRAEAHARRVPVKLLFPLVFLVLPAFVLLTVVPGLVAGLERI